MSPEVESSASSAKGESQYSGDFEENRLYYICFILTLFSTLRTFRNSRHPSEYLCTNIHDVSLPEFVIPNDDSSFQRRFRNIEFCLYRSE